MRASVEEMYIRAIAIRIAQDFETGGVDLSNFDRDDVRYVIERICASKEVFNELRDALAKKGITLEPADKSNFKCWVTAICYTKYGVMKKGNRQIRIILTTFKDKFIIFDM